MPVSASIPKNSPAGLPARVFASLKGGVAVRRNGIGAVINGLKAGLPVSSVKRVQELLGVKRGDLSLLMNTSERTLARRTRLNGAESERLFRVAELFQRAVDVLGNAGEARRWFLSPKKALAGSSPLEFARTELGAREVDDLLGRIEHGVFS